VVITALKLCHLKNKDVTQFTLLMEKGGKEMRVKERKKSGEEDRISQNFMGPKGFLFTRAHHCSLS
jgi:hypothetical protein